MPSILVVEDDREIREILCQLFESEGFQVYQAANGEEALQLLRETSISLSMISLDVMMPVMDGQTFLLKLQRNLEFSAYAETPIVIVSAGRGELQGAIAAYVPKPPDFDQLIELAHRFSEAPQSQEVQ